MNQSIDNEEVVDEVQEVEEPENIANEALVPINPEILLQIDNAPRNDWEYDTYVSVGIEANQVKGYSQWILGKLASEVSKRWKTLEDYASSIGVPLGSLSAYQSVYDRFISSDKDFVPPASLPWGALLLIAKTDNPALVAKQLEDKGIHTMKEVAREISENPSNTLDYSSTRPAKPKVWFEYDDIENKWIINLEEKDLPNILFFRLREAMENVGMSL